MAHSYGGSIITEAGDHPHVAALVYVAAHAPDVGEDEAALGREDAENAPPQQGPGAVVKTADGCTYLRPDLFPWPFAADLPLDQAKFEAQSQVLTAAVFSTADDGAQPGRPSRAGESSPAPAMIISPDLERFGLRARPQPRHRARGGASHSVYESRPKEVAAVI